MCKRHLQFIGRHGECICVIGLSWKVLRGPGTQHYVRSLQCGVLLCAQCERTLLYLPKAPYVPRVTVSFGQLHTPLLSCWPLLLHYRSIS